MKLTIKTVKITALAALTVVLAGCSGINASHSVSPATFLLPGAFGQTPGANPILASQSETGLSTVQVP